MGDDDNDTREGVARMRRSRQLVWRLNLPETKLIMEFLFFFIPHEGQKKRKIKNYSLAKATCWQNADEKIVSGNRTFKKKPHCIKLIAIEDKYTA